EARAGAEGHPRVVDGAAAAGVDGAPPGGAGGAAARCRHRAGHRPGAAQASRLSLSVPSPHAHHAAHARAPRAGGGHVHGRGLRGGAGAVSEAGRRRRDAVQRPGRRGGGTRRQTLGAAPHVVGKELGGVRGGAGDGPGRGRSRLPDRPVGPVRGRRVRGARRLHRGVRPAAAGRQRARDPRWRRRDHVGDAAAGV
ncbi:MAG: hypothetical protein AVDCRST_MAG89-4143, partial [uncultured Gemmatimonadetes bacterium]